MDLWWSDGGSEERFAAYVAGLSRGLGHVDRVGPFRSYCTGLLLPGARKSVEPMAARLRPDRTAAEHQSLLHFVGQSPWDVTDGVILPEKGEVNFPTLLAGAWAIGGCPGSP